MAPAVTRTWRRPVVSGLLVAILASTTVAASAAVAAGPADGRTSSPVTAGGGGTIRVGSQTLHRCGAGPTAYCGTLAVPLDWGDRGGPTIRIAFRWYPASSPPGGVAAGTVLPAEGGPGYPSIGSVQGGYQVMYGPLLERWNMLAIDLRGTGLSTPIDCPALQHFVGQASGGGSNAVVGACAARLNHRWRTSTGAWVHASDLFTSAPGAADHPRRR